jgi:hypothetical protein
MGMKTMNPLQKVSFYKASEPNTLIQKQAHEITQLIPEKCQSTVIRLFVKDEAKFNAAKRAFN